MHSLHAKQLCLVELEYKNFPKYKRQVGHAGGFLLPDTRTMTHDRLSIRAFIEPWTATHISKAPHR